MTANLLEKSISCSCQVILTFLKSFFTKVLNIFSTSAICSVCLLALQNLEYVNMSKETTARSQPAATKHTEQILTFSFRPKDPGEARVLSFELPWSRRDQL